MPIYSLNLVVHNGHKGGAMAMAMAMEERKVIEVLPMVKRRIVKGEGYSACGCKKNLL
jgi:hypothetical protein